MAPRDEGSVTRWIGGLKLGDQDAAQGLWERYFERLVRLARARLASCAGPDEDEEDAALSAFDSFCAGLANGRFPRLADREDLWRLLVVITARKVSAQVDRRRARKRGGLRLRADAAGPAPDHIVPIYEVGRHQGHAFYAMKLIEGRDLGRHLGRFVGDRGAQQP